MCALPGFSKLFAGEPPTNIGIKHGKLATCPDTPNCVVSQDADAKHKIEPLAYGGEPAVAIANIKTIIQAMERSKIIEESENYLYAEFSSNLMGFVDDVEFYLIPQEQIIHVRAAARLGKSDLGVNRKRIESIRAKLAEL
ncbi:MAG: DUF1499 domain-containing protein [Cyanothece sp. SIO1E1]|nr:DUF1499 domain-containing protein [Cyanothece sp. SIO1E1]